MPSSRDVSALLALNVGCGYFPREDSVNVDFDPRTDADVFHDLNVFPYPFPDQRFERIYASHVLEHLADPFAAMDEWHRLLRPGGDLRLRVPHFSRGFTHPDHKRGFDVSFPLYFDPKMKPWYMGTHFELRRLRLHWNDQPYLIRYVASAPVGLIARAVGALIDTVANLWPMAFSRLFAFWVGGFEALEMDFVRPASRDREP